MEPKVLVAITSYNRKQSLCNLVANLLQYDNVHIAIFDDQSDWNVGQLSTPPRVSVLTNPEHRGKAGFWRTYNDMMAYIRERQDQYNYFFILPDDVEPCPEFIKEAIASYHNAGDPICLSPLLTNRSLAPGISRWGNMSIHCMGDYYVTNYFDCCTVCRKDFFEALDWKLLPILPSSNPLRSSGVGRQITTKLQAQGKRMCHVGRTLLTIVGDGSQMNPEERKRHPMVANWEDNYECVDVHMASLYRGGHLLKTLQTLAGQPEVRCIYITLNNYSQEQYRQTLDGIKELCKQHACRIVTRRAKNQKGSNEKLSQLTKGTAPYIAFADDDILYPQDYFLRLIHGIRLHNAAVSFHGGVLRKFPTDKYYDGGRKMYAWNISVPADTKVDIMGTGVGLIKREWFTDDELKALYADAPEVSMDDIIVSCLLSQKGIERWVLEHAQRIITTKKPDPDDAYVYDQYKANDAAQVEYINKNLRK